MMNYFLMGYPNRLSSHMGPGTANPSFPYISPDLGTNFATSGYFLWIKSTNGYPWDVKTFDQNYVYDRSTELVWGDPTSFKRFNQDLPMSHRCAPIGKQGATIKIPSASTNFTSYSNCQPAKVQNLGYVKNQISVPRSFDTKGNLGTVLERDFIYQYSCDSNYENCKYQEIFRLGYQVGIFDWRYYNNVNGKFQLVQESKINHFGPGSATPYLPCSTSYE